MRSKKRERIDDQRHDFDARSHKRYAYIDWFDDNSGWSQSAYHIPNEYAEFFSSFQATIQEAINSIDIDGKQNGDVLDAIIDAEAHIALRKIRLMRVRHQHSLMEIATTKEAHLYQIREVIALLERETEELKGDMKED